jgi:predicted N-acetyltransferase YhbS
VRRKSRTLSSFVIPPAAAAVAPSSAIPVIDAYRAGDAPAIVACLHASFGEGARLTRWEHVHLANPTGPSIIVLAREGGRVVGQIASLKRRLRFFGDTIAAAHVLDTMVHPDWQRRGVFQHLVAASEAAVAGAGIAVSYGVANDVALHASQKYEHRRPLGAFPVLVRPLRPLASLAAVARHYAERGVRPDALELPECGVAGPVAEPRDGPRLADAADRSWHAPRFDATHTRLFAEADDLPPIAFVRDAAHLGWRYAASVDGPYVQRDVVRNGALAATAVVRLVSVFGLRLVLVMEWHWRRGAAEAGRALAQDVLALARRAEAHAIAAMAAPRSQARRMLTGLGFLAVPSLAFPQRAWPGVHVRGLAATDLRWWLPANWHFTWGDGLVL